MMCAGGCINIGGYSSKIQLILKPCKIMFLLIWLLSGQMVLKFCTEHSSDTAVLCTKFQNHLATEIDVIDKKNC